MQYKIELPEFEGPFDLLLHLIKKDNINIQDICIEEITKQYLKKVELFVNKFNLPYGRMDKIAEIPEHCKLINNEPYIPEDIDKEWYIKFCYDKIKELVYV